MRHAAQRTLGLPALSPSRTSSHATLFLRSPFSMQTPVERSERLVGCWTFRARVNPLFLGVWHFTLRFALPGVGLATPGRKAVMQSPTGPKVYPNNLIILKR